MSDVDEIAARLRAVIRSLMRCAEAISGPGIPARSEQSVLAWLHDQGPMSPKALADVQKIRPQTVAQTLDSLTRNKWIKRSPHPNDRRQILISLSPSGEKALAKGRALRQAWLVGELKKLPPRDRKTMTAALEIFERFLPIKPKLHPNPDLMNPPNLNLTQTALVLIDLQKGILKLPLAPRSGADVLKNSVLLADKFREAGALVVLVHVGFSADGADAVKVETDEQTPRGPFPPEFMEFVPEIGPRPNDIVILKRQWGAFTGTELDLQLRRRGIRTIVLGGVATNYGVESTARSANELGYAQVFVEDAMSSRSEETHSFSIRHILPRLGLVRSTDEVLAACSK